MRISDWSSDVCSSDLLPLGEVDTQARQYLGESVDLFGVGALMHPVHAGLAPCLQGLGGADVGQYHELLDQHVRLEAVADADLSDVAGVVEDDPLLRDFQVEGASTLALAPQRPLGAVPRFENAPGNAPPRGIGQ